jgi:hypothetical protein
VTSTAGRRGIRRIGTDDDLQQDGHYPLHSHIRPRFSDSL